MEYLDQSGRHSDGNKPLGNLLKAKREAAGLTITQLALELGVSRPYLSRLERGQYEHPSSRVLTQITKRLGISVEDAYAVTGYTLPQDLPSFGPYMRAKHRDWPDAALRELEVFCDFLKHKYSLK